jgi:hypothetical protein
MTVVQVDVKIAIQENVADEYADEFLTINEQSGLLT